MSASSTLAAAPLQAASSADERAHDRAGERAGEPARVFICFTDYQVWVAQQWQRQLGGMTIVRCTDHRLADKLESAPDIVNVEVSFRVGTPPFRTGVRSLARIVDTAFQAGKPVEVACSTYHWPLNRALAHQLGKRHPGIAFGGFSDGLASFLQARLSPSQKRMTLLRTAWSIVRPPFVPLSLTDSIGSDWPQLATYYAFSDSEAVFWSGRTDVKRIGLQVTEAGNFKHGAATLLGWAWMTVAELEWVVTRIRERGWGREQLCFKPHPSMKNYAELAALCEQAGLVFVDDRSCVERIIEKLGTRTVLGSGTTALISLKMVFGEAIEAVDFATPFTTIKNEARDDRQVRSLFDRYQVASVSL